MWILQSLAPPSCCDGGDHPAARSKSERYPMGSKSAILVLAEGDPRSVLRPGMAAEISDAKSLAEDFFDGPFESTTNVTLEEAVWPEPGMVCTGRFTGADIICARELVPAQPSDLTADIALLAEGRNAYAVFMHSGTDSLSFATWEKGRLVRSLSLSPDDGVVQNYGAPLEFESPYWTGNHSVSHTPNYPLPFHPLDLGNEALRNFFGFILEGRPSADCFDPEEITLCGFRNIESNRSPSELLRLHSQSMTKRQ
ncbi:DUF6928 family protein [Streptomyces sp. NPDC015127]|uniref:DUF6928 family protein n=1 Tax=Streptomyces sp. NPDC015127 TaxID=3364939 RepID=UPI0037006B4C